MTSPEIRRLGRYELLFLLGQGGMGEVHLARLTGAAGFEKLCIVKTVLPNLMGDQNFIDRFHHEARVLVQLTHSNIAQVHDMGEVDGTLYMAIEYVPGVDLSRVETRIERQKAVMPLPVALAVGMKISEALGYAHRKVGADGTPLGIVHRDVSPQNVMVSYEGEVKVIDFGLAKSSARSKHTQANTVMGKLGYMSPEQAMARPVDHRSDIFSAGIVVWEMITGRPLYGGGTMAEMVAQMAYAELPSLLSVRPDISPTLDQIVMRALAKEPSARYQRGDDFARALNEFAVREGLTIGSEDVGNYVRAICPEEFAAERQLQSRLSVMRKRGSSPDIADEPTGRMEAMAGTFVRDGSSPGLATPNGKSPSGVSLTAAQKAMSVYTPPPPASFAKNPSSKSIPPAKPPSGAVQPADALPPEQPIAPPKKSALPFVIVGLLAVIGLAGAGLWFTRTQEPVPEPVKEPLVAVKEPVKKDPEPEVKTEPENPDPAKEPAVLTREKHEKAWKLQLREDGYVFVLGADDKLSEGDRLDIAGEDEGDGTRPVYAHGAVMEIKGSIVSVLLDDDETPLPKTVFAARDLSGVNHATKPPKKTPVKKDPVVKKDPEPTKEPVKEPVKKDPEPVKVAEPAKVTVKQLYGKVQISAPDKRTKLRTVLMISENPFPLTNCELRLPMNFSSRVNDIAPNDKGSLAFNYFRQDGRPPLDQFTNDWSAMYCREGSGYWKTTYAK